MIGDKPMIQWVYELAANSQAKEVIVATDDQRIFDKVNEFGGQACMTGDHHQTGSDRILEVAQTNKWSEEEVVVNLQGDEPLMPVVNLDQVAGILVESNCEMATLFKKIDREAALNPNQVKLVTDGSGKALYFSRSIIPFDRDGECDEYLGHIGLYAYRVGFLSRFSRLESCHLEITEKLEQLRTLWHGYSIATACAKELPGPGIDTEADLQLVTNRLAQS